MGTVGRRPQYRTFARTLGRNLRTRRGETAIRDFAKTLGISKSELHRIEQGEQNISISMIELICKRLDCSIADLFHESNK